MGDSFTSAQPLKNSAALGLQLRLAIGCYVDFIMPRMEPRTFLGVNAEFFRVRAIYAEKRIYSSRGKFCFKWVSPGVFFELELNLFERII